MKQEILIPPKGERLLGKKRLVEKGLTRKRPIPCPSKDLTIASAKNARRVENKQRQIVDGSCRLFFKKGYHPTTIREIANASGMSMGQLYHYISSKDDVL